MSSLVAPLPASLCREAIMFLLHQELPLALQRLLRCLWQRLKKPQRFRNTVCQGPFKQSRNYGKSGLLGSRASLQLRGWMSSTALAGAQALTKRLSASSILGGRLSLLRFED